MSLIKEWRGPYSALEAWFYDTIVAPAAEHLAGGRQDLFPQPPAGSRVLDVGCGGGQNLLLMARKRPDLHFTGLDLSAEQLARARRRARAEGAQLQLVQGSALELPFIDGRFDVVMSIASLKHWPDQRRGLAECLRVLRPGGQLFVAEVDRACRFEDAQRFVALHPIPRFARPLMLAFFRTWVAGRSITAEEGRRLLEGLPLDGAAVERVESTPVLLLSGTRRAEP